MKNTSLFIVPFHVRFGAVEYLNLSIHERINFKSYFLTREENAFQLRVLSEVFYSANSYYKTSPFPLAWGEENY